MASGTIIHANSMMIAGDAVRRPARLGWRASLITALLGGKDEGGRRVGEARSLRVVVARALHGAPRRPLRGVQHFVHAAEARECSGDLPAHHAANGLELGD